MKKKKAYLVTTVMVWKDLNRKFLKRYIVVSISTTKAISMIKLIDGEEIVEAIELTHELVLK